MGGGEEEAGSGFPRWRKVEEMGKTMQHCTTKNRAGTGIKRAMSQLLQGLL